MSLRVFTERPTGVLASERFGSCLHAIQNGIAQNASVGSAPQYWAPMTESFRQRVSCLVSRRRMGPTVTYWSPGSPAWSRGLWLWLLVSTFLSIPQADTEHAELADRFGIGRVVLVALDVGLYVFRRHQPHFMTQLGEFTRPIM